MDWWPRSSAGPVPSLAGPDRWLLSGLHRGLSGEQAGASLPSGAGFVLLDQALAALRLPDGSDGVTIDWTITDPQGVPVSSVVRADAPRQHRAWSPVDVRANRDATGVTFGWIRRGNHPDAGWGGAEVPVPGGLQDWKVTLRTASGATVAILESTGPSVVYPAARELADFGALQSHFDLEVVAVAGDGLPGGRWSGMIPVTAV
jgi:hypothetical protein